jgi:phosphoribosylamine-glycine ligase
MLNVKNVLVIGSGGREHAICWKLQKSPQVAIVHAFPGSAAIAQLEKAKVVSGLNLKDFQVGNRVQTMSILSASARNESSIVYPQAIDACLRCID